MEEEYILNGKVYKASDLNSYAKKSGLSLNDYIKESGAKLSQASQKNYSLGGKNYDKKTLESYAKKSGLSFDEYLKEAGVKKKGPTDGTQANQASGSKPVQQPVKPSSGTEKQGQAQPSASSSGGKMRSINDLSEEELKNWGSILQKSPEEKILEERASNFKEGLQKGKEKGAVLKNANKKALKTESIFQESYKQEPVTESTSPFLAPRTQIGIDGKELVPQKSLLETIGIPSKEKVEQDYKDLDLDNPTPYLSASTYNRQPIDGIVINKDNFVDSLFGDEKLKSMGIDPADFDGYLNLSGFKDEYNKRNKRGDFDTSGDEGIGPERALARDIYKNRLLSNYISTVNERAVLKSKLESVKGSYEGKKIPVNKNARVFDNQLISSYIDENLPALSSKLKEQDKLNKEKYEELVKDNSGLNSLGIGTKNLFKSGYNSFVDSMQGTFTTVFDELGGDQAADELRYLNEQRQLERPTQRQVAYADGKVVNLDGKKYLVDEKGTIYDKDNELIVNDLIDPSSVNKILEDAKKSKEEDWFFSPQGTAVQAGSVVGDMVWQVAWQATVGRFTKGSNLLTKGLTKLSIPKATADAIIAQSSLGYSQAYETTLKEAKEAGLTEKESEQIAGDAAQRTAVWYGVTSIISPQTKAVESLFGSAEKSLIKKAVNAYKTDGKQGFISTLNQGFKELPKKAVVFGEEGGKEFGQENIQQGGDALWINAQKNIEAGKEISDETVSYSDFINNSILSFLSGGTTANLKMPSFSGNKKTQIRNLYQLSQNMDVLDANLNEMVSNKVITKEDADNVKKDAIAVSRNVTRIPKDTDPNIQLDVMRKLSDIQDLEDSKKTLDKSFHPQIDNQIQEKRNEVENIYKESLKTKPKEKAAATEVVTEEKAVAPTEVVTEKIKQEKTTEPTIVVHGAVDGFGLQYSEGISTEDIVTPKDGRGFLPVEQQKELNEYKSVIEKDIVSDNGDKSLTIITPSSDNFGRSATNTFEFVIPEGNTSTSEGIKSILDNVTKSDLKGKEVINESVKQVKEYINSNKPIINKEVSKKSQENSLPLFEQLEATETTKQKNRLLRNNPTVAFVSKNLDTIIDSVEGAQRVEC